MVPIQFSVTMEPFPAPRPRVRKDGWTYNTPQYEQFKRDFVLMARPCRPITKINEPVHLTLFFYIKKPKSVKRDYPTVRPDLDNYVKAVKDCLYEFWVDDSLVVCLSAYKKYSAGYPSIHVDIRGMQ